ncbi:MAG: BlaI/MecI/CopY family transcriptional regulator [Verrucomicrobiota bacterium]
MSREHQLSRRERQIMDVLHEKEAAAAAEIRAALPDPPSYSSVRALLRILEDKGHIKHRQDGPRYVYLPSISRETASKSALKRLIATFFQGSATQAMAALLEAHDTQLSDAELNQLQQLIKQAKKEGR